VIVLHERQVDAGLSEVTLNLKRLDGKTSLIAVHVRRNQ
jgi:hypothetical protein